MERLFTPKTAQETELVNTITRNSDRKLRLKALKQLRIINGVDANDLYTIRSKENYTNIKGKPAYFTKFNNASIVYDDCKLIRI